MRGLLNKISEAVMGADPRRNSKDDAKQRLKLLLIHDQIDLSPGQMEKMKEEIREVISRYVEVDPNGIELRLNREDGHVSLVSNVPVRRVITARA